MPVAIPLIAAGLSVSAGIAAGGLVGGLMIAGGAMSALGAVTKDKTLTQWGQVLGLAGGVSGLASGAWQDAATTIAQDASTASDVVAPAAEVGATAAGDTAALGANQVGAMTPSADAFTGGDLSRGAQPTIAEPTAPTAPAAPAAPAAPTEPMSGMDARLANGSTPNLSGINSPAAPAAASTIPPDATGGVLQPAVDWAKANPRLVQAGSGLLTAGLNYYGQQDAIKTSISLKEAADQRARDRLNASTRGLTSPTYQPPVKGR